MGKNLIALLSLQTLRKVLTLKEDVSASASALPSAGPRKSWLLFFNFAQVLKET